MPVTGNGGALVKVRVHRGEAYLFRSAAAGARTTSAQRARKISGGNQQMEMQYRVSRKQRVETLSRIKAGGRAFSGASRLRGRNGACVNVRERKCLRRILLRSLGDANSRGRASALSLTTPRHPLPTLILT